MGSRISDWNKSVRGEIPMSLGFTYSSNTLMMHFTRFSWCRQNEILV